MNRQQKLAVRTQQAVTNLEQAKRAYADLPTDESVQVRRHLLQRIEDAERRLEGLRIGS
jgi:hypothetical protein